jgi:hypothetical protein
MSKYLLKTVVQKVAGMEEGDLCPPDSPFEEDLNTKVTATVVGIVPNLTPSQSITPEYFICWMFSCSVSEPGDYNYKREGEYEFDVHLRAFLRPIVERLRPDLDDDSEVIMAVKSKEAKKFAFVCSNNLDGNFGSVTYMDDHASNKETVRLLADKVLKGEYK